MTVASPGFLLYGFFSGEWLIEDLSGTLLGTGTGDDKIYYGLYRKCQNERCSSYVIDETAFGLEVTSVLFQFLAILALPWLKPCIPDNKYLKYWNYCFIPFLFIAAIFSLSASCHFLNKYDSKTPHLSTGSSQVCAGLGGGFQIVLACIITGFFWHHELLCFQAQSRPSSTVRYNPDQSLATTSFTKTENIFISVFSYQSITTVDGNRVATEQQVVEVEIEHQQQHAGYRRQMERY